MSVSPAIIWLASYPRSGNEFARLCLACRLHLRTIDLYADWNASETQRVWSELLGDHPIAADVSSEELASSTKPWLVKTHELPAEADYPAIYLVRDGRDVLVSYAHYTLWQERGIPSGRDRKAFRAVLKELITSTEHFGGWSAHVLTWIQREAPPTVVVRYEDLVTSAATKLREALAAVGWDDLETYDDALPTFEQLHKAFPQFFRKGKVGGWRDEMSADLHELFWKHHGEAMASLNYLRDGLPGPLA